MTSQHTNISVKEDDESQRAPSSMTVVTNRGAACQNSRDRSSALNAQHRAHISADAGNTDDSAGTNRIERLAERIMKSFQGYLGLIFALSIFGAQAFSSLVGQLDEPEKFSKKRVREFLAGAWVSFMFALALSIFAAVLVQPYIAEIGSDTETPAAGNLATKNDKMNKTLAVGVMTFAEIVLFAAFALLALVVMAYVPVVGWVSVALIAIFALLGIFTWAVKLTNPEWLHHQLPGTAGP